MHVGVQVIIAEVWALQLWSCWGKALPKSVYRSLICNIETLNDILLALLLSTVTGRIFSASHSLLHRQLRADGYANSGRARPCHQNQSKPTLAWNQEEAWHLSILVFWCCAHMFEGPCANVWRSSWAMSIWIWSHNSWSSSRNTVNHMHVFVDYAHCRRLSFPRTLQYFQLCMKKLLFKYILLV